MNDSQFAVAVALYLIVLGIVAGVSLEWIYLSDRPCVMSMVDRQGNKVQIEKECAR